MTGLSLGELEGHGPVYGPAGGTDLPGVVLLHGSEGPMAGWSHRFAAILAAHGVLALPWAYGEGDLWSAGPIRDVDIRGAPAAVAALARHPRCRGAGVFGWSRGGELAVLLAAIVADDGPLRFVAAHAASDVVNGAFDPRAMGASGGGRHPPDPEGPRAWRWPGEVARLTPGQGIEIERYPGPVFLSVGTADEIWDHGMTLRLAERRDRAGRSADLFVAEGQGHGFDFGREPELWSRLLAFIGRAT